MQCPMMSCRSEKFGGFLGWVGHGTWRLALTSLTYSRCGSAILYIYHPAHHAASRVGVFGGPRVSTSVRVCPLLHWGRTVGQRLSLSELSELSCTAWFLSDPTLPWPSVIARHKRCYCAILASMACTGSDKDDAGALKGCAEMVASFLKTHANYGQDITPLQAQNNAIVAAR